MIYRFSDSVHCAYASWYDVHSVSSVYTTIDLLLYTYINIHKTVTSPLAWCIFKYGIRWKLKIYAPNYSLQIFCTLPIAAKTATYLFLTNFAVEKTNINLIQCETCSECDQMWISGDFGFFFFFHFLLFGSLGNIRVRASLPVRSEREKSGDFHWKFYSFDSVASFISSKYRRRPLSKGTKRAERKNCLCKKKY